MDNLARTMTLEKQPKSQPVTSPQLMVDNPAQPLALRDSLSDDYRHELDAWARHCLAANGFGDYC